MPGAFDSQSSWERVAAELRACKEAQQQAYGDVDSTTLGRYLAGEMSPVEAATLEQTLAELPELRKLTDLVQDVLRDIEPLDEVPSVPQTPLETPSEPVILPISAAKPRRRPSWLRRHASVAAAACLFLALGALMPRPSFMASEREAMAPDGPGVAFRTSGLEDRMVFLTLDRSEVGLGGVQSLNLAPQPAPPAQTDATKLANPFVEIPNKETVLASSKWLNQAVVNYYQRGEVDQAAKTLREAHRVCKKHLGEKHRATQWTARQLAGVLQFALNEKDAPAAPVAPADDCPRTRALNSARVVRQQITSRSAPDVRQNVVPLLTDALGRANKSEERLALTRALGELGPAARPAVPLLCDRLRKSFDPRERLAILQTLDHMGSAAARAVPTLTAFVGRGPRSGFKLAPPPKGGFKGKPNRYGMPFGVKYTRTETDLARSVLNRLTGREARVGVFDSAGLFCLHDTINATRTLRKLARESDLEIRIDTQPNGQTVASMLPKMGAWAMHVVISDDGKRTQVNITKTLHDQGIREKELGRSLGDCARKGESNEMLQTLLGVAKRVKVTDGKK